MSKRRQERLSDLLKEELSYTLFHKMQDPRLSLCNITDIKLTPDYHQAKVYISVIGDDKHRAECLRALNAAAGFFRHGLGKLNLRHVPSLTFCFDTGPEYLQHIEDLLKEAKKGEGQQ
jgi:ribosome-binding factor A